MSNSYIKFCGTPDYPRYRITTYEMGVVVNIEYTPYPVPYLGSVVPMGFRCTRCGGAVVTDWLYYYGPGTRDQEGQWGGECLECKQTFTTAHMKDVVSGKLPGWRPPQKPVKAKPDYRGNPPAQASNFHSFDIGSVTLYVSYQTIIGFKYQDTVIAHQNIWGTTTGKHLNWVDGGNHKNRLNKTDFQKALATTLRPYLEQNKGG